METGTRTSAEELNRVTVVLSVASSDATTDVSFEDIHIVISGQDNSGDSVVHDGHLSSSRELRSILVERMSPEEIKRDIQEVAAAQRDDYSV